MFNTIKPTFTLNYCPCCGVYIGMFTNTVPSYPRLTSTSTCNGLLGSNNNVPCLTESCLNDSVKPLSDWNFTQFDVGQFNLIK